MNAPDFNKRGNIRLDESIQSAIDSKSIDATQSTQSGDAAAQKSSSLISFHALFCAWERGNSKTAKISASVFAAFLLILLAFLAGGIAMAAAGTAANATDSSPNSSLPGNFSNYTQYPAVIPGPSPEKQVLGYCSDSSYQDGEDCWLVNYFKEIGAEEKQTGADNAASGLNKDPANSTNNTGINGTNGTNVFARVFRYDADGNLVVKEFYADKNLLPGYADKPSVSLSGDSGGKSSSDIDKAELLKYLFGLSQSITQRPDQLKIAGRAVVGEPVVWELSSGDSVDYYETPAPRKQEHKTSSGKKIIVKSGASELYNVLAFTDLPALDFRPRIYKVVNSTREDISRNPLFDVKYIDSDSDGLYDRLEWNIPSLVSETFEVDYAGSGVETDAGVEPLSAASGSLDEQQEELNLDAYKGLPQEVPQEPQLSREEIMNYLFGISEEKIPSKEQLRIAKKAAVDEPVVWAVKSAEQESVDYYETSAPQKEESPIKDGKRVVVSSDAEVHYYNVTAFTDLPKLRQKPRLFRIINESRIDVTGIPLFNVSYLDTDSDGLYDRMEWNVPQLSNDTYEIIIEITMAEHLDENRAVLSNIYESVSARDDVWSEEIPDRHFVRVRFERNLTSSRDITVFPRIVSGNPSIEVYEIDKDEIIAEFTSIISDDYNRVYLADLAGEQDSFDLRVMGGSVEFDLIIDPPALQIVSPENKTYFNSTVLVNISASDPSLDTVWYNWNGTNQIYAGPVNVEFEEGQNILHVWANDTSGGTNYTNVSFVIKQTPGISFVSPPTPLGGSSSNRSNLLVQVDSSDADYHYTLVDFDESILGWYRFESGDATDSSSKNNHGTVYGASSVDEGFFGKAMDFDGFSNYIDTEINYGLSTGDFSFFAWVKDIPSGNRYVAAQTRVSSPYSSDWILGYPNGGLWFRSSTVDGGNVISNGNWHLIGLTFNGTTAKLYIDGSQYGSSINPTGFGGVETVKLMTRGDATSSFTSGFMDDVFIFNRTISLEEIESLYNASSYQYNNNFSDLSEGNHSFTAYAVNSHGNINQTEKREITLDISSPSISIDSPLAQVYFSENQTVDISASDPRLDSIWFNWNGTNQDYSTPINVTFTEGVHTLIAFANDTAGNMNSENVTFTINLSATDYISPTIAIHSPAADGIYDNETILVNITAFDTSGVDNIWYNHNGTDNNYTSPEIVYFGQGSNLMHVWANDTYGNINYTNISFYVDSFAPDIEFVPPTPNSSDYVTSNSIYVSISSADLADHYSLLSFNNDLLGWYRLEEQSWSDVAGEVIDESNYGHHGRARNGANTTSGGKFGRAGLFDGNNDYIDTTISYNLSAGSFSVFAWAKDMPAGNKYIVSQARITVPSYSSDWILGFQNGGLWFRSQTIDGGNLISDGNWHLIGFTFDGTSARLYIDDAQRGSPITPSDFGGIGTVKLMTRGDATTSFVAGLLDDVIIVNRTLKLDEIKSLYDAKINQYENNFTGLADGNYSIKGFAVDSFGYKNETEQRDIPLDANEPNITIISPINSTYPMNFILFNLSVADDNLDEIWYNWNGSNYAYTTPVNITFAIGSNTLHVWANDSAGNIAYKNVSFFTENEALTGCGIISSPGKRVLPHDIYSLQTCLFVQSDDVEIDCDGHTITYDTSGTTTRMGIDAIDGANPRENLTVRNCVIVKPTNLQTAGYGIRLTRFSNSFLINNTIRTNGTTNNHGIFLTTDSANNVIENNTIYASGTGAGSIGIYAYSGSSDIVIKNNRINTSGTTTDYGILISTNSHRAIIEDNTISTRATTGTTTSGYGVYIFSGSDSTVIRRNNVRTSGNGGNYGIYLQNNISNNEILNNNISTWGTTGNYGIHLLGTAALPVNGNDVSYNTILANGSTTTNLGIYLYTNTNSNTITNNNITTSGTTTNYGIYIRGIVGGPADNNVVERNRIYASGTAGTSTNYGIYLNTNVNNNVIYANNISTRGSTANHGIYGVGTTAQIGNLNISSNIISTFGTGTNNAGIYLINNITNARIQNNNISTLGTTTNYGIEIAGTTVKSNSNIISYNKVSTGGSGANNFGIYLLQNANSNQVFRNNISTSGTATNYGIYFYGTALLSVNSNTATHNKISTSGSAGSNHGIYLSTNANSNNATDNVISVTGTTANYGVYIVGAAAAASNTNIIENNNITAVGSTTYNSGVVIATNANSNSIISNNITTSGTTNNYGVYLTGDTLACDGNKIISNMVNASGTGNANYGLYMYRNINSLNATGNTILTYGTTTGHGVYATGTATEPLNNNIISSNVINARGSIDPSTNYGIYFTTNANSNTITNNNVSTFGTTGNYGISVIGAATATSNNNIISSNRVVITGTTANNWGIYLATNANSNRIFSNHVETSGSATNHGVYLSGTTYKSNSNAVYSNDISASGSADSNYGVYLYQNVNYANVSDNNISTSGTTLNHGIYATGTATLSVNNSFIDSNIINASGSGISNYGIYLLTNANRNTIRGNDVRTSGSSTSHGIFLSTTLSSNNISGNTIAASGASAYAFYLLVNANRNVLAGNAVSGVYGYYFESSSHNLVSDCGLVSGTTADVFVNADITPTSLNNTFLNCSYLTESVAGAGNYLTRKWYFSAAVNNSLGYLENANVQGLNISDDAVFSENTTALGVINRQELAEYVNLQGTRYYKTPHTIVASKRAYTTNTTVYNLSFTQNINHFVILEQDSISPVVTIHSPENKTYISPLLWLNVSVVEDNPDETWYNWNGTNYTYAGVINITFDEGPNTIFVWANDTVGNINSTNVTFSVVPLLLNITSPIATTYNESKQLVEISVSVPEAIDTIWYNWNGTNISYTGPVNITFLQGYNTLYAWANDSVNNIITANVTFYAEYNTLSACGNISASGKYVLDQDITSTDTCLAVRPDNVEI
ncbi:MAG: LamG-like jellyroll fold domain-containing protein, partial [Candidatus Woesearchaeota archaeon]